MKEIHTHLNLQPPSFSIASEGEESPKIKSFEEMIARFDTETPVQQWYNDASFSGFDFDYGGMAGASSSHPPPFDSPPPVNPQNVEALKDLSNTFWCLMTMEEKYQLKLEGLALLCSILFCLKKLGCLVLQTRLSDFFSRIFHLSFHLLFY
jgi:hypothetical protein